MNKYIVYYGAVAISAYGVGAKMVTLAYIPVMSIGAVLATFVGQNLGAGNTERARKAFHTAMKLSTLYRNARNHTVYTLVCTKRIYAAYGANTGICIFCLAVRCFHGMVYQPE